MTLVPDLNSITLLPFIAIIVFNNRFIVTTCFIKIRHEVQIPIPEDERRENRNKFSRPIYEEILAWYEKTSQKIITAENNRHLYF